MPTSYNAYTKSCICYDDFITLGHHRWYKTEEDGDSEGSNYSGGEEGTQTVKRRSIVSDEDYQSSEDDDDDGMRGWAQ